MNTPPAKPKRPKLKRILLIAALCILAVVSALLLTYGRAAKEGWDLRNRLRQALKNGEQILGSRPASEVFSDESLRLLCGENPVLLAAARERIEKAVAENPAILQTEISAIAVACEFDADGKPANIVLYVVGELNQRVPQPKKDGSLRQELGSQELLKLSKSLLAIAGRDVQIFGEPAVAAEHRETLDAVLRGETAPLETQMQKKRRLRALLVNPNLLMPDSVRDDVRAVVFDLRGSMSGSEGEIFFITKSRGATGDVSTLLDRWRTLVLNALHARGGARSRTAADTISKTKIDERDASVVVSGNFSGEIMSLSMNAVRATGRAIWGARNAPTADELKDLKRPDDTQK